MKPWLPPQALDPVRLQADLDRLLGQWSDHWLGNEQASAIAAFQDDWPAPEAGTNWRSVADVAAVALTSGAALALASAMLGVHVPQGNARAADRSVTNDLAEAAVDDLLRRIADLVTPSGKAEPGGDPVPLAGYCCWDIAVRSGRRAFRLALSAEAQVAMVKRRLSAAKPPRLDRVATGLADQPVSLIADLGRSSISLADLEGLGPGDVIVLDQAAGDPVGLLVDGLGSPFRGALESGSGGQAALRLHKLEEQQHV